MASIIVLQIYILLLYPEEKRLYEECQWKTLCEKGVIQDRECEIYLRNKQNVFNITPVS